MKPPLTVGVYKDGDQYIVRTSKGAEFDVTVYVQHIISEAIYKDRKQFEKETEENNKKLSIYYQIEELILNNQNPLSE
jgi:hypothetical protein